VFEREIHTEKQRLLRLLDLTEPFLPLQKLLQLPDSELAYKRYFWAEVRWRLYEEQLLRQRHPYFDYSAPALAPVLRQLDELLLEHARFPRQEIEPLVDTAVKVRLNFLCRPRTTLKWFVFRGEPVKPRTEILARLAYFADYPELITGLRQRLEQLELPPYGDGVLSVLEFERLVQQVDDAVLEFTPRQFLQLLQPLGDFFRRTNPEALPEHLPTAALIVFLDDKGIAFLAQELERQLQHHRLRWISHTQFLELVARLLAELEASTASDTHTLPLEFPTEPPPEPPAAPPPPPSDTEPPHSETEPSSPEDTIAAPHADTTPGESPAEEPPPYPEPLAEWLFASAPEQELLWSDGTVSAEILQAPWTHPSVFEGAPFPPLPTPAAQPPSEHTEPESPAPASLLPLLNNPAWQRRYLRVLFPSEAAFAELRSELLGCTHWKEAARTLDRFFARYGIDPHTRTAEQFRQEVLQHYRSAHNGDELRR